MNLKNIELELANCLEKALLKENNILRFLHISRLNVLITTKIALDLEEGNIDLSEEYVENINRLLASEEKLESQGRTMLNFQYEMSYKLYYQAFEEFMFDLFVILFKNFPKFLNKDKIELQFDLIFGKDEIELIRLGIIENRVKKYIQSNNIKALIKKFETIFGIKLSLTKKEIDKIFFASKVRNVLTHNNGIVNDIFINELSHEKIKTNYLIGESIIEKLEYEIDQIDDIIIGISKRITFGIMSNLNQLDKYSASL
ncbi:MAG: hypothetical protein ACX93I_12760 [Winogradskyella sp.]|jgi:hypothetical protein